MTSPESRQQALPLAMALFAGCALVALVIGTLMGAYGAPLGAMRLLVIVAVSWLTGAVVRRIWMRRHLPWPAGPTGPAARAAAVRGIVLVLLAYVALMAALGAFLGYFAPALGIPRPYLTGFATVMSSLILLPLLMNRVETWRRSG